MTSCDVIWRHGWNVATMNLRGSGHLTFQKGCYSIAYVLLEVKRHFLPSPHPTSPRLVNSKTQFFHIICKKKVIETAKKCDCDRKRLLKRLGCFKSLKTSQGRLVVKTLKYTFFPLVYKIEVEDAAHETHNMLLPIKFLVAFGSWGHLL